MTKITKKEMSNLGVDELLAFRKNADELIAQKQHQRLFDAYKQFEDIADGVGADIEEILEAGESLKKERSIKYRDPTDANNTWTGRGRKPKWIATQLANGKQLQDFLV